MTQENELAKRKGVAALRESTMRAAREMLWSTRGEEAERGGMKY